MLYQNKQKEVIEKLSQFLPRNEEIRYRARIIETETALWEYWGEFVYKYLRTGRSKVTVSNAKDALLFVVRNCNILTIQKCNNAKLLEDALFETKESRGSTDSTFNSYLKNLKTYFIWLEKQEYIQENNLKKVSKCKEIENEQYTLSHEQVKEIVQRVHDWRQSRLERKRNIFFIDLLRFTGARPCEIEALQTTDIVPYKNTYKIKINGAKQKGKPRYISMHSFIRDSYEQYINYRNNLRPKENHLFISSSKNTGWTQKGMTQLFKKLSKELGFRIIAYGFRRYVLSTLYSRTKDMRKLGDYVGHTRATTTLRYVEQCCARTDECGKMMAESFCA